MRLVPWVTPLVLVVEAGLLAADVVTLGQAGLALLVIEVVLGMVVLATALSAARRYRATTGAEASRGAALEAAIRAVLPGPVAGYVVREARLMHSLLLWIRRRRHGVPPGAVALRYDADMRPVGLALLVAGVIELVVIELLVPWPTVRLVLLVLSAYTLMFVLALIADICVRPHVLTDDTLRLRLGSWADVTVPLSAVALTTKEMRNADRTLALVDGTLTLAPGSVTWLRLELDEGQQAMVGRTTGPVRQVRFTSDDPSAAVAAIASRGQAAA